MPDSIDKVYNLLEAYDVKKIYQLDDLVLSNIPLILLPELENNSYIKRIEPMAPVTIQQEVPVLLPESMKQKYKIDTDSLFEKSIDPVPESTYKDIY